MELGDEAETDPISLVLQEDGVNGEKLSSSVRNAPGKNGEDEGFSFSDGIPLSIPGTPNIDRICERYENNHALMDGSLVINRINEE